MGFIKKVVKNRKISLFCYLILNVSIFTFFINWLLTGGNGEFNLMSIAGALELYAVSVIIATSPIGEWAFRLQLGCHKIERADQLERLEPLFNEVYSRAKQLNPSLSDKVELVMNNDREPNAFAGGRKTICITKGMYEKCTDEELKGVIAHEFSHIANRDTDLILVVTVGNILVTATAILVRLIFGILSKIGTVISSFGSKKSKFAEFNSMVADFVVIALVWVWAKIGQHVVLSSCRQEEFKADLFACKNGYGVGLCSFLDKYSAVSNKGVFAALSSKHPSTKDRIHRLQELGCSYEK